MLLGSNWSHDEAFLNNCSGVYRLTDWTLLIATVVGGWPLVLSVIRCRVNCLVLNCSWLLIRWWQLYVLHGNRNRNRNRKHLWKNTRICVYSAQMTVCILYLSPILAALLSFTLRFTLHLSQNIGLLFHPADTSLKFGSLSVTTIGLFLYNKIPCNYLIHPTNSPKTHFF